MSLLRSSIPQKLLLNSSSGTGLLFCCLDEARLFDLAGFLLACELDCLLAERFTTVYYDSDSDLFLILLVF